MTELITRTPSVIASEIYSIKGQTRNVILLSSIEIGKRLVEAKSMLKHGEWGDWLKGSVDYSQSTANNLMQIYREYGSGKFPMLENLPYSKAIALLGVPEDERVEFIAENDIENMSSRELQQLIKDKQKVEKQLKAAEAAAEKERKAHEKMTKKMEELQRLNEELKAAQEDFNGEEEKRLEAEIIKTKDELQASRSKVRELEEKLKQPIDVAVVEKIPEAIERELEELRKSAGQNGNASVVKFRLQFDDLVKGFNGLLHTLAEFEDEEMKSKYKGAVTGLLSKMSERL